MQSDTWALASADVRPWLLMLWVTSWQQVPCGSMPADDALIVARLGIAPKVFAKARAVLLRGWWRADDGRLYHDVITGFVRDMLGKKVSEAQRKKAYRERKEADAKLADWLEQGGDGGGNVPPMSHGTDAGQTRDSGGSDATRTRTRTGLDSSNPPPGAGEDFSDGVPGVSRGTDAGRVCGLMRRAGLADVNPSHPALLALIDAGAADGEFEAAAGTAVDKGAGFGYALTVVANERKRAAKLAGQVHRGPLPVAVPAETAHARKMREAVEGLAPSVARRPAGPAAPSPLTVEMEVPNVVAIASR